MTEHAILQNIPCPWDGCDGTILTSFAFSIRTKDEPDGRVTVYYHHGGFEFIGGCEHAELLIENVDVVAES